MKIVNTSSRVVCIAGKHVLPGESISVSDAAAGTAGMKAVVKVNGLTFVEEPKAETKAEAKEEKAEKTKKAKKVEEVEELVSTDDADNISEA